MEKMPEEKIVALIGYPVGHSLSPVIHNAAFKNLGVNFHYTAFAVLPEELENGIKGIRAMGFAGANITIPHKERVIPFLDALSDEAHLIGAVNTIKNENGRLIGLNTDCIGFRRSLKERLNFELSGKKMVLFGAGGAGKAVAFSFALAEGKELIIFNRTLKEGEKLADKINRCTKCTCQFVPWEKGMMGIIEDADIVVNAVPIGMFPKIEEMPPIPVESIRKAVVCDLIYNPEETVLLRKAREKGLQTVNGLGMLIYQAAEGFRVWTGMEAPVKLMFEAAQKKLYFWNKLS